MNVFEIVGNYLKDNGYDGLMDTEDICACSSDDVAQCGKLEKRCVPAYLHKIDCSCGCKDDPVYGHLDAYSAEKVKP
jgi:hypothetical protein